jgi:hypothetical protein
MNDPTSVADDIAAEMRRFYEANRETWWDRLWRKEECADNLMLGLLFTAQRKMKEYES